MQLEWEVQVLVLPVGLVHIEMNSLVGALEPARTTHSLLKSYQRLHTAWQAGRVHQDFLVPAYLPSHSFQLPGDHVLTRHSNRQTRYSRRLRAVKVLKLFDNLLKLGL